MGKKIIILNGSPRKNGNTSSLTAEFRRGAEESGNEVTEFFLGQMKINGCLGCWHGGKDPKHPCMQKDDMEQIYPEYREAACLVPVPIHKNRKRKRGFNQAEVLANHLGKICGIPVLNALERIKNTESQTKLTREERKQNIVGAFMLAKNMEAHIDKQALILIDDVCTTSATLEECARVLKEAGAREVLALTALRE